MQSDIVREARLDAKAFRENAVYTSDGQRVNLGANADRLDAYANHMDAQTAEITRLTEALRAAEEREKRLLSALEEWMFRYFWRVDGMPVEAARIHAQSRMKIAALVGGEP